MQPLRGQQELGRHHYASRVHSCITEQTFNMRATKRCMGYQVQSRCISHACLQAYRHTHTELDIDPHNTHTREHFTFISPGAARPPYFLQTLSVSRKNAPQSKQSPLHLPLDGAHRRVNHLQPTVILAHVSKNKRDLFLLPPSFPFFILNLTFLIVMSGATVVVLFCGEKSGQHTATRSGVQKRCLPSKRKHTVV